eukprot:5194636-Pyramimonas_sp.AAC.1
MLAWWPTPSLSEGCFCLVPKLVGLWTSTAIVGCARFQHLQHTMRMRLELVRLAANNRGCLNVL